MVEDDEVRLGLDDLWVVRLDEHDLLRILLCLLFLLLLLFVGLGLGLEDRLERALEHLQVALGIRERTRAEHLRAGDHAHAECAPARARARNGRGWDGSQRAAQVLGRVREAEALLVHLEDGVVRERHRRGRAARGCGVDRAVVDEEAVRPEDDNEGLGGVWARGSSLEWRQKTYLALVVEDEFAVHRADVCVVESDAAGGVPSKSNFWFINGVWCYDSFWLVSLKKIQRPVAAEVRRIHRPVGRYGLSLQGQKSSEDA